MIRLSGLTLRIGGFCLLLSYCDRSSTRALSPDSSGESTPSLASFLADMTTSSRCDFLLLFFFFLPFAGFSPAPEGEARLGSGFGSAALLFGTLLESD